MTGKRYKLHYNYHFGYGVEDTYDSDRLYLDEFDLLVDELNTLNDKNEQLKQYKQSVSDVLLSWSQKSLTAKQLQIVIAIMEELNVMGDVE